MSISSIIYLIVLVIYLVISIIVLVIKRKTNKVTKNNLIDLSIINEKIIGLIVDAENKFSSTKQSGDIKKEVVLTKVNNLCIELGIPFDVDYWGEKIDVLIELTRQVNK